MKFWPGNKVFCCFVPLILLLDIFVPANCFSNAPEFIATQVHQETEQVFGMDYGDFDPLHDGKEVACLTRSGSVLQLSPILSGWQIALRSGSLLEIIDMSRRPTISIGDVYSRHPGNEVVIEGECGFSMSLIIMVYYSQNFGWTHYLIYDSGMLVGGGWGARVGDFDPRRSGDEIFHIYEGVMDWSNGTIFSNISHFLHYDEELVFQEKVGMDSAAGDFNPDHPGPEIVIVDEMNETHEILPPLFPTQDLWPRRTIWTSYNNAGWVVKIADVDPCNPGNEIIYGTRYSNRIMMSHHNGANPHELQILFTGSATGHPRTIWDIAVGEVLPEIPGLEILGVDETGSVYLVSRVGNSWDGQVIWQDTSGPLYAVITGDFLPNRRGHEILVAGESGIITLLTLKFTGDFTADGKINFYDFAELARYWKQNEPSVDISPWPYGDGLVDMCDAAVLVENWLLTSFCPE